MNPTNKEEDVLSIEPDNLDMLKALNEIIGEAAIEGLPESKLELIHNAIDKAEGKCQMSNQTIKARTIIHRIGGKWQTMVCVSPQTIYIGPTFDDKETCEWYEEQFRIAMSKVGAQFE